MTNEDISQNPEKLRALALERGARIERLERALRDMLSGWKYIRSFHGDLYGVGWDRAQQKAEEALADDGAGEDESWMPEHGYDSFPDYTPRHGGNFVGTGGPLPGEPGNPNPSFAQMETDGRRDALEALDRIAERAIRSARGKEPEITDDYATVGEFIRRSLTAPPTVPESIRRLPEQWNDEGYSIDGATSEFNHGYKAAKYEDADFLARTLAQHSEPGGNDGNS